MAAGVVCAEGSSNAVNERIPVSPKEMEAHWQVDCAHSWARTVDLRARAVPLECAIPADLLRELKLCAFIYQPPGQQFTHFVPDYQSATVQAAHAVACLPKNNGKK